MRHQLRDVRIRAAGAAIAALCLVGCSAEKLESEPLDFTASAVTRRDFTDGSGTVTVRSTTSSPWVTASIGGYSVTAARFLADLIPLNGTAQGFTVRTKELGNEQDTTIAIGHSVAIRRQ
jgi:hypothetical protein